MSTKISTNSVNEDRVKRLNEWQERIWKDGSYIQWVNDSTKRLHVERVATEIVGTKDTSIFSKWAKPWKTKFNEKYTEVRKRHGEILSSCDADGQHGMSRDDEAPDALLERFMEADEVKALGEIDAEALKVVLNSYQSLSCERYITKIQQLEKRERRFEVSLSKKDEDIDLLQDNIEHYKIRFERDGKHHTTSIRSTYSYADNALCPCCLKES